MSTKVCSIFSLDQLLLLCGVLLLLVGVKDFTQCSELGDLRGDSSGEPMHKQQQIHHSNSTHRQQDAPDLRTNNCTLPTRDPSSKPEETPQSNSSLSQMASSLEPVYFAGSQGPTNSNTDQASSTFYQDYNQQPNYPTTQNPVSSFYAMIGPQGIMHQGTVRPHPDTTHYPEGNYKPTLARVNDYPRALRANWPSQLPDANLVVKPRAKKLPDYLMTSDTPKQSRAPELQPRPQQVNLSKALDSGQVVLSKQMGATGAPRTTMLETISLKELRSILERLKPLEVQEGEADEATDEEEPTEQEDEDGPSPADKQDLEVVRRHQNRMQRTVPESAFYEGSSTGPGGPIKQESSAHDGRRSLQLPPVGGDEDLQFLRNLINVDERAPRAPLPHVEPSEQNDRTTMSPVPGLLLLGQPQNDRPPPASRVQDESQNEKSVQSIPIDRLVDHLMSNSRLATFGVQHNNVDTPANEAEESEDDDNNHGNTGEDDDDDEEGVLEGGDDDDEDPETQEAEESNPSGTKVAPTTQASYSSLTNTTSNWIPMQGLSVKNERDNSKARTDKDEDGKRKKKKKKKKKKRRRKRRRKKRGRKEEASVFGLVVGNRILSRTEVIKLIRILNKMANKGKPSKERDASRKLLRFLIKLVLEEYKKDKWREARRNKKNNSEAAKGEIKETRQATPKDPIRDLLRSVLMGPVDTKTKNASTESSIELRPLPVVKVQPETTTREPERDKSETVEKESKQEQSSGGGGKPRGLGEISDELENYFDNDFFEDMADRETQNTTRPGSRGARSTLKVTSPKRRKRRRPRPKYRLPVPIYGQQSVNKDGDDIDPDLDREQLPRQPQPTRRRYARKRRPQILTNRRKHLRRKRPEAKRDRDEEEPPDDDEGDGSQEQPDGASDKHEVTRHEERTNKHEKHKPGSSDKATDRSQPEEQNPPEDEQEEEPAQGVEEDQAPVEQEKPHKNPPRPRGKTRRKQGAQMRRVNNAHKRTDAKKKKANKVKSSRRRMAESRYEIPAPIVAGQPPTIIDLRKHRGSRGQKRTNASSERLDEDAKLDVYEADSIPLNRTKSSNGSQFELPNNPRKASPRRQKPPGEKQVDEQVAKRRGDRSVGLKRKKALKKKPANESDVNDDEPADIGESAPNETDTDYYNESSSYLKLCDDDGNCKVKASKGEPSSSDKAVD